MRAVRGSSARDAVRDRPPLGDGDGSPECWPSHTTRMAIPSDYWASYEGRVGSLSEFVAAVRNISAFVAPSAKRFAWRGVQGAAWPLDSSLVRAFERRERRYPSESELTEFEGQVLDEARDWGLDWHQLGGRLAALELLAALQHWSVPTRMIDFTFNPMIALWFAVEGRDTQDGRVFAFDIGGHEVPRDKVGLPDPWWWDKATRTNTWTTRPWVWTPPPFEARIIRQDACFVMGGLPSTVPWRRIRRSGQWENMSAAEIRGCMSIPFTLVGYDRAQAAGRGVAAKGRPPKAGAFTLRISNKPKVRAELRAAFGYSYRTLFPDFAALADRGKTFPHRK